MTTNRQAGAGLVSDNEAAWQRVIGDGLREAQTNLSGDSQAQSESTQQGWQIVGQAFESGLRALAAMRN